MDLEIQSEKIQKKMNSYLMLGELLNFFERSRIPTLMLEEQFGMAQRQLKSTQITDIIYTVCCFKARTSSFCRTVTAGDNYGIRLNAMM